MRDEALPAGLDTGTQERLLELRGMTLHRLLGFTRRQPDPVPAQPTNPLRHDVVVVDETSMVALSLMARLLEALRPDARLIIVGDHEQLASVEAGAVLGDIVGPAARGLCMDEAVRTRLGEATGHPGPDTAPTARSAIGDGIVVLRHVRRHGGAIAGFARAIQAGTLTLRWPSSRPEAPTWIGWPSTRPIRRRRRGSTVIRDCAVESGPRGD